MSKQWCFKRDEITLNKNYFKKPYCPERFDELYSQLDFVCEHFPKKDIIKTLTRKIIEEVMNIVEHNKGWNKIIVRTELNSSKTRFKAQIIYDGGAYYDPQANCIGNVISSTDRFEDYNRDVTIEAVPPMNVVIRINITP